MVPSRLHSWSARSAFEPLAANLSFASPGTPRTAPSWGPVASRDGAPTFLNSVTTPRMIRTTRPTATASRVSPTTRRAFSAGRPAGAGFAAAAGLRLHRKNVVRGGCACARRSAAAGRPCSRARPAGGLRPQIVEPVCRPVVEPRRWRRPFSLTELLSFTLSSPLHGMRVAAAWDRRGCSSVERRR